MFNFDNKKIEIIDKKFFTIFKIENFFENSFYEQLKKNYPVIVPKKKTNITNPLSGTIKHHEIKNEDGIDFRPKIGTEEKDQFDKILKKNETLKTADEIFNSDNFFNFIIKNLKLRAAADQNNYFRKIKYLRPTLNLKKIKNSFFKKFISDIKLNYSYTSMQNNGFLRPHSDSPRKFISLLMYFPEDGENDLNYGTCFWNYKRGNYNNVPIINEQAHQNFKNYSKLIYKTPFIKNCFFGFIRTDFSWHSVEPVNVNDQYIRKTLTVNFMYDN